jgi:glycine betaine/choline ABC-type transport system substrate-binding protein
MVRRLALALIALITISVAGCGGQAGPPSIPVGAAPDAESALVAHLYAAALRTTRSLNWNAHARSPDARSNAYSPALTSAT